MPKTKVIPDGEYTIISKSSGSIVGRRLAEDKSLRPKGIFTNGPSTRPSPWTITRVRDNAYELRNRGAPVGDSEGLLWALLIDQGSAGEWNIIDVPQMGKDCYIIVRPNLANGWAASLDENPSDKQIAVRPLIVMPSYPPRYPLFEVFEIKPVGA